MAKYQYPKKHYYKAKKSQGKCAHCGRPQPDNLLFSYVDEANAAITRNSPDLCWRCYNEKYPGDRIGLKTLLRCAKIKVVEPMIEGDKLIIGCYEFDSWKDVDIEELIKEFNL